MRKTHGRFNLWRSLPNNVSFLSKNNDPVIQNHLKFQISHKESQLAGLDRESDGLTPAPAGLGAAEDRRFIRLTRLLANCFKYVTSQLRPTSLLQAEVLTKLNSFFNLPPSVRASSRRDRSLMGFPNSGVPRIQ